MGKMEGWKRERKKRKEERKSEWRDEFHARNMFGHE